MKNHIFIGLVALVIGVVLGFILDKPETKFLAGETVISYRDTCELDRIIADVITESNTITTGGVKKGKVQKDESTIPVAEVTVKDSIYTSVFSKLYDTGLMRMKVTTTVKAKSAATAKINLEYEMDTLKLKEMTTIVNTVVVQKDTVDVVPTEVTKFLPVESTPKKMTYLGVGGLVTKNPKQYNYSAGFSISHGKTSVSLFKDFTQPIKSLDGYSIGINKQLVRMSAK